MQGYRFAWIVSAAIVIGPAVAFDLVSGGWLLRTSTPLARRLVLVEERHSLLDELERRDPSGFDDWVATLVSNGARPHPRGGGERSWKPGW